MPLPAWLLNLAVVQAIANMIGRPQLALRFDAESSNCREIVPELFTYESAILSPTAPHAPARDLSWRRAAYLRAEVANVGRSRQAEGCRVFLTRIKEPSGRITQTSSPLQWAHVAMDKIAERFNARVIFPQVDETVDICSTNEGGGLLFITEFATRGGHRFFDSGAYEVTLYAVGTNWVSPGWITLRVIHDRSNPLSLTAEVVRARTAFRVG